MGEISVIVPVYRAEAYLDACVSSILAQTFSDLEVILVDDGSPDISGQLCDRWASTDSRVRVLHQANAGQAAARNRAMKIAQGNWICFVDSDDCIHPQMVELLYRAALEGGCPISQCRYVEAPQCPEDFAERKTGDYQVLSMEETAIVGLLEQDEYPGWVACAKLIRRELIEGYLFREGRVYEDNEAVCRWIVAAGKIADIPENLYFYRTNPNSTTKQGFSAKKLDYLWALESIIGFYSGLGWLRVRDCFVKLYIAEAPGAFRGAREQLCREDLAKQIESGVRKLLRSERVRLTDVQKEALLEAMHPNWLWLFWKVRGIKRRLQMR